MLRAQVVAQRFFKLLVKRATVGKNFVVPDLLQVGQKLLQRWQGQLGDVDGRGCGGFHFFIRFDFGHRRPPSMSSKFRPTGPAARRWSSCGAGLLSCLLPRIPGHGLGHAIGQAVGGRVAEQASGFANVGLAVAHIAGAKAAVNGLHTGADAVGGKVAAQQTEKGIEGGAVAHGHVVDLVHGLGVLRCGGQQVGLHHVGNKAEVAAGFTVAIDVNRFALDQAGNPFGDDGGIGALGVLAGAEHVEVAQANGVEAVAAGKHVGIQFVDVFGDGVGAEGFANDVFHLGQAGVVAIGAAAGGVGEAFDTAPCIGIARGHEHVQKPGDVGGVGGDGVFDAAGHTAQCGLVQHVVHTLASALAVGQLADVALDEAEVGPLGGGDKGLHFIEVALVAGGKVVQAHHALIQLEQGFEQVAANEAGHAGDEPGAGCCA